MSFKSYYYHILSWLHYCLDTNYHGCITTLIPQYTASCLSGRSEEAWGRVITNLAEKIPGVFSAGLSLGDFGGKQGNKQGNFYMFNDYRIWDSFEIQWNPLLCRDSDTRETSLISWYIVKKNVSSVDVNTNNPGLGLPSWWPQTNRRSWSQSLRDGVFFRWWTWQSADVWDLGVWYHWYLLWHFYWMMA